MVTTSLLPTHFTVVTKIFIGNDREFKLSNGQQFDAPFAEISDDGKSIEFFFPYTIEIGKPISIRKLKERYHKDSDVTFFNEDKHVNIKNYKTFINCLEWMMKY